MLQKAAFNLPGGCEILEDFDLFVVNLQQNETLREDLTNVIELKNTHLAVQLPNDMLTTGKVRVNQEGLWSDYNAQLEILLKTENEDFKKDNQQELDSCVQFRNRTCSNVKEAYCLHFANMMGPIGQKLQTATVEFGGHKDGFIWCQHLSGAQSPCSTEAACGKRRSKN